MPLIDPPRLRSLLGPVAGRFDVDSVAEIDSTSSELLRRAADGAPAGTTLVADRQTAGRGRRGRDWFANPGDCLMFSLLWRFDGPAGRLSGLSLAVGVAVAVALEKLGVSDVGLKWPNDVLLAGGKVAGILVELASDRRGTQAVIGIGLNMRRPAVELPFPATGLSDELASLPDRHVVLAELLVALTDVFDRFAAGGFADLQIAWQGRHAWQGKTVSVLVDDTVTVTGPCLGADADGALLIATAHGTERFLSGDISLRPS